jgi:hypothetical protein
VPWRPCYTSSLPPAVLPIASADRPGTSDNSPVPAGYTTPNNSYPMKNTDKARILEAQIAQIETFANSNPQAWEDLVGRGRTVRDYFDEYSYIEDIYYRLCLDLGLELDPDLFSEDDSL